MRRPRARSGGMMSSQALPMVHRLPLVVALLLVTALAASAQLTFDHKPKTDPYRNLFGERDVDQKTNPPPDIIARGTPEKPIVVCGMRIRLLIPPSTRRFVSDCETGSSSITSCGSCRRQFASRSNPTAQA